MDLVTTDPHSIFKVKYGEPFKRDCVPPRSAPAARPYWIFVNLPGPWNRVFKTINVTNIAVNENVSLLYIMQQLFYAFYTHVTFYT